MDLPESTVAQQVARAVVDFHRQATGHAPASVTAVLSQDTLVVTLHGALSPAEQALARSPAGIGQVQEFHRQLFATTAAALRAEIERITGVGIRQAAAEVEAPPGTTVQIFNSGTVVQVFLLAQSVPPDSWSGPASGGEVTAEPGGPMSSQ